jgi:23S rRNA (guanine745-N1)-methyltransferase
MSLQTLSEWLRCPICFHDLSPREPLALACDNGHSFDANKRGYVSLIAGSGKLQGDSPAMLDARDAFLRAGWYSELRTMLSDAVADERPNRIVDVGCGTGYYLGGVLERSPGADALAMDLSPAAVGRTVRSLRDAGHPGSVDGLVADVWSPLPIRDGAADVIINVFAPRNAPEFHRLLRPDGLLAVVVPQDGHLAELRSGGLMLDVQPDKAAALVDALAGLFGLSERRTLTTEMQLTYRDIGSLVGMGPSAHHQPDAAADPRYPDTGLADRDPERTTVHAAFELLLFRRRPA